MIYVCICKVDEPSEKQTSQRLNFKFSGKPPNERPRVGLKNFRELGFCLKRVGAGAIGRPMPPPGLPNCPSLCRCVIGERGRIRIIRHYVKWPFPWLPMAWAMVCAPCMVPTNLERLAHRVRCIPGGLLVPGRHTRLPAAGRLPRVRALVRRAAPRDR